MKHVLTHQILLADFYLWQPKVRPQLPSDFIWIDKQDLEKYALPRLIEVLLKGKFQPKILSPFILPSRLLTIIAFSTVHFYKAQPLSQSSHAMATFSLLSFLFKAQPQPLLLSKVLINT